MILEIRLGQTVGIAEYQECFLHWLNAQVSILTKHRDCTSNFFFFSMNEVVLLISRKRFTYRPNAIQFCVFIPKQPTLPTNSGVYSKRTLASCATVTGGGTGTAAWPLVGI